jgi:predicted transcriptional regulator
LLMKNKKALRIKFKSLEAIEQELLDLPKKKHGYVQPQDVILFESLNAFRNFLTLQKLEILMLIAAKQPKSVYELAGLVGRAIAPVQKDCHMLSKAQFIYFEKEKGGRGSLKPKLKFDYDRILVEMQDFPYELWFRSAG